MVNNPVPLIAEVDDIANCIRSGVAGIQLSDETAVGSYALDCVRLILRLYRKYHVPEGLRKKEKV